jgi:imidazoleglycerol-phosphate dehydratase
VSEIVRETGETTVTVNLQLGQPSLPTQIRTTDPVLDHMLATLARYAGLNLAIEADGDLRHHLIEDVAISIGLALRDVKPAACRRFGHALVPMDEALVEAALDAGGRFYYAGRLPSSLFEHFFRSFAENAGLTLHVRVLRGRDRHHIVEAAFKATGFALRQALAEGEAVFSTKGAVRLKRQDER